MFAYFKPTFKAVDNDFSVLPCAASAPACPAAIGATDVPAADAAAPAPMPPVATANAPIANTGSNLRGAHLKFYSPQLKSFLFQRISD